MHIIFQPNYLGDYYIAGAIDKTAWTLNPKNDVKAVALDNEF